MPWQPPRPGEKLHFEKTDIFDISAKGQTRKGEARFVTDEVVTSVADDAIDELEVTFVQGRYQPDPTKALVELNGMYRVKAGTAGEDVYSQNDQPPASAEVAKALRLYGRGDVGRPHLLLRILTDRTFELGRETHLPPDSVPSSKDRRLDVRVTLKTIAADRATFSVESYASGGKLPFKSHGTAVLDTAHARLVSLDEVGEFDLPADLLRKYEVSTSIETHEKFRYDSLPAVASPTGCNEARTIFIPPLVPQVGDIYSVDEEVKLDETMRNDATSKETRLHGGWVASTDERIAQVTKEVATAIELRVRKERVRDFTNAEAESAEVSHDGDVIEVRRSGKETVFTRNGIEIDPANDLALTAAMNGSFAKGWATRLVTERTFQLGVEQTFSHELIHSLSHEPSRVRITLRSIDGDVATFELDIKSLFGVATKPRPVFYRGELTFDIKKARPLHLHLDGDFEVRDGLSKDGEYVFDDRFRYER